MGWSGGERGRLLGRGLRVTPELGRPMSSCTTRNAFRCEAIGARGGGTGGDPALSWCVPLIQEGELVLFRRSMIFPLPAPPSMAMQWRARRSWGVHLTCGSMRGGACGGGAGERSRCDGAGCPRSRRGGGAGRVGGGEGHASARGSRQPRRTATGGPPAGRHLRLHSSSAARGASVGGPCWPGRAVGGGGSGGEERLPRTPSRLPSCPWRPLRKRGGGGGGRVSRLRALHCGWWSACFLGGVPRRRPGGGCVERGGVGVGG